MSTHPGQLPAFTITLNNPDPFALHPGAFQAWIDTQDPEELDLDLPRTDSEHPSRDLSNTVHSAREAGAIAGDHRLNLAVHEGDDDDSAGYYLVVSNANGPHRLVSLTTGWTELELLNPDTPTVARAHAYLTDVCAVANDLLHHIEAAGVRTA